METVIKRAFHVQIGSRMILRSKKKNKISTNYSLRSLLPIQFHERNSWTECTFLFFSSQLWSTGARLSKSVSLTPVRFDPLSSSLSLIPFLIERVFRPLILFARNDLSVRHRRNNAFIVRYLLSSKEILFLYYPIE